MRVQRTRAARFARIGSPLTRHPLGASKTSLGLRTIAVTCVVALVSAGLGAVASPESTVKARIVTFGIYRQASGPSAGLPLELEKRTTTVPACLKTDFGYQVLLRGLPPGAEVQFKKVVVNPPMHKPDGSISTGYELVQRTKAGSDGTVSTHQGYGLDHPYEAVLGQWTIEFWHGSQRLASKTFDLVPCKTP
jgi:hypothetical protein